MIEWRRIRQADHCFFTAPDGVVYHVYDRRLVQGRWTSHPPPVSTATSRAFVPETGPKRLYNFGPREGGPGARQLTEAHLEQQLRDAEYLATAKYDPGERRAR